VSEPILDLKNGLPEKDGGLSCLSSPSTDSSFIEEKKGGDARAREETSTSLTFVVGAFDQFWKSFPNKVGKRAAMLSFERVRKSGRVTFDDLMAGLRRYAGKTDDRHWCNPATWLNQDRWTDEPAANNGGGNVGTFGTNRGRGGGLRLALEIQRRRAAAANGHANHAEGGSACLLLPFDRQ
jgi:hypothetical protein